MNLVTLRDVSVAYDGYEALRHVDLEIADLDFLGVIGPNGGGKTTLVKAILGTVPHTGELTLAPELFRGKERLIGYMPQISDFDRAFPISVLEVVLSGLQGRRGFSSRYTKEDRARAMELLAASGIADTARSPIGENIDFVPFAQWDDLPSLEHDIRADDCLWFVMSRRDRVSYNPVMSRIPAYLEHFFSGYSSVLLYPVQAGDTESRYI